jgi:hypothetical protein
MRHRLLAYWAGVKIAKCRIAIQAKTFLYCNKALPFLLHILAKIDSQRPYNFLKPEGSQELRMVLL